MAKYNSTPYHICQSSKECGKRSSTGAPIESAGFTVQCIIQCAVLVIMALPESNINWFNLTKSFIGYKTSVRIVGISA